MKKLSANEIRTIWLNFWKERGHYVEPSASLIPQNDPTLLWINAGVAALKKYFDGTEIPTNRRITNVQKSLRTNDIENVGMTARHHTFFEMLGNFSIGDYFRNEVIPWAYDLLTNEKYFGIDKDTLYITYHPDDLATRDLWIKQGMDASHMIPLSDNFWCIGEGPCGPDTEIFFDRGEKYDPKHLGIKMLEEDIENDRYIEIWNIVFSQYNAVEGVDRKDYKELPNKNIDTGGGLERFACIMQGTETNFETDLFMPIIKAAEKLAKYPYDDEHKMCYRVIADHIRTCTFALADGASFSNEGRGYVLRRILRRAVRYGRKLGIDKPFMYHLVQVCADNMKDFYPYLENKVDFVSKIVKGEEEKFLSTLNSGEAMLRKMIEGKEVLDGKDAFKLYDTYGFPIELTKEICQENNVTVDEDGFKSEMAEQKERARNARGNLQSMNKQSKDLMDFTKESEFHYETLKLEGKVIGLFVNGEKVEKIEDEGDVIFDNTPFYSEMGGQIADKGVIQNENTSMRVTNVTKAPRGQHLHHVVLDYGTISLNDKFVLSVDVDARHAIMRNHSALHLLQAALKIVLGDQVHQEGSYVSEEYGRFDFNYFEKLSDSQLNEIEERVNNMIAMRIEEETQVLPIEEAKKLHATALFNEKYGDVVRVVCFGNVSKEFCGGTHVANTEDIGAFVIESEESIAAGIRRIQVRTGLNAYKLLKQKELILMDQRALLNTKSVAENNVRLKALISEKDSLKAELKALQEKQAVLIAKSLKDDFSVFNGHHMLVKYLEGTNRSALVKLVDELKVVYDDSVILLIGQENGNYPLVCSVSKVAVNDGIKAGVIIKEVANMMLGSGGGRPDMASGAGKDISKLASVTELVKKLID